MGARHNANGLRKAGLDHGPLAEYVAALRTWTQKTRSDASDETLIGAMRRAYRHSYPVWAKPGSVWGIFANIKDSMGVTWDECRVGQPCALLRSGDRHGRRRRAHPISLGLLVLGPNSRELKPRIVFVSKDNMAIRSELSIAGEDAESPMVVRYSNHGTGKRRDGRYASKWIPQDAPLWRALLGTSLLPGESNRG